MTRKQYEAPAIVIELMNLLADNAIVRHSNDDETFLECLVCGEWDGHADECPMPAIERWLKS